MVRVRMPVRRGVTVGRAIAAPDVAARHAQPQVIPPSAHALAVLAALTRGHDVVDQVEMAAGGCHGPAPFGRASWEMLLTRWVFFNLPRLHNGSEGAPEEPIRTSAERQHRTSPTTASEPAQIGMVVSADWRSAGSFTTAAPVSRVVTRR